MLILKLMPATHFKQVEKVTESLRTPVWNILVTSDSILTGMKGASLRGSAVLKQGWGEVHHFVKHVIV